jgi:hypothetical protein
MSFPTSELAHLTSSLGPKSVRKRGAEKAAAQARTGHVGRHPPHRPERGSETKGKAGLDAADV